MQKDTLHDQLISILTPLCEEQNIALWGLELSLASPKHRTVRIFIDSPEGVTIDQCAEFSRHASVLFDVEDILPGGYNLEVSSPGLDRTFFSPDQLDDFVGNEVKLTLHIPRDGCKNFRGTLVSRTGDVLTLRLDDQNEHEFSWNEIRKLKLVFTG
jgi:ribosome maturation factor RimP